MQLRWEIRFLRDLFYATKMTRWRGVARSVLASHEFRAFQANKYTLAFYGNCMAFHIRILIKYGK